MLRTLISLCLAIAATLAVAQQKSTDTNTTDKQKKQDKDSGDTDPLFGTKKLGYKSSTNTKESSTLAFNGIDPSGKVASSVVSAAATGTDADKVKKMADSVPKREQLLAFAKEGGLISR